ncbi:MAG: bifunctional metallophosphatase/5'-nucleotidase [Gammaproteobacteria bacterium]|nr:bifunctional metallophosphatase/5'-nucleotidase [Gammaproteobacteria bacterium]
MSFIRKPIVVAMAMVLGSILPSAYVAASDDDHESSYSTYSKEITLIHMGDLHGHTTPRPNLRSDGDGRMEGGLARMYTKIKRIRENNSRTLLINTGDTTQGSGEALYTRGKALVDVVDMFNVQAFAAGNWEFVYGPDRFKEFFGNGTGKDGKGNRWGALASNLYNTITDVDSNGNIIGATSANFTSGLIPATLPRVHTVAQYDDWSNWYLNNGTRILPAYSVKDVDGVKVGIIGCTTRRGPQVVGSWVVDGIEFTDCQKEVEYYTPILRDPNGHNVDLLVLITEIEVGVNIQMVRTSAALDGANHIDVILNSDMHEETREPIRIKNKSGTAETLLIEEGQDGTMLGELKLTIRNKKVVDSSFRGHRIHDGIEENEDVARKVKNVRYIFTKGFDSTIPCNESSPYYNTFSGTCLTGSLDEVVGSTEVGLHRSNYSDENMPAVLEGTSHDFIADAIRWWAQSDLATVRGFRYGTHVKPGPITRNDLYHFIPIGARIGKASRIHVGQLRNQVDNSSQAVFSSDPGSTLVEAAPKNNNGWAGGWLFAYSADNFSVKFDPYHYRTANVDSRARELTVAVPCDRLPAAEQAGCTDKAVTQITNGTNGAWMANWGANLPAPLTTYALQTDPVPAGKLPWNFKSGTASKQNQLPALSVAGYWYERSPLKLNNCPNCNPAGLSNDDNSAEAPYILPVNVNDDGTPALDASGKPVLLYDADGNILREADNRPKVAGKAIELVTVIEKYLAANGPANPVQNRITLVDGASLPGRDVFGFPVMQPLCGTIPALNPTTGVVEAAPTVCPNQ